MKNKTKLITTAGVLASALIAMQGANAHMEPKDGEAQEKCYGVVKAGENDCASKANKHFCAGMAITDNDANEWVKLPSGLCEKIVGGSLAMAGDKPDLKEIKNPNKTKNHGGEHKEAHEEKSY